MKHLYRFVSIFFSRTAVCITGIIIQIVYLGMMFWTLGTMFIYSYFVFSFLSFIVSVYIINKDINPSYKVIWVFTILSFPVFGCMFYWFYGYKGDTISTSATERYFNIIYDDSSLYDKLLMKDECAAKQAHYMRRCGNFPMYNDTETVYFENGESFFPVMISELNKAESFIYLEYFILQEGTMWNSILSILQKKAENGVDVRIIYDDIGCLLTLPRRYYDKLKSKGIQCCTFGRLKPFWTPKLNNRDHRKMMIIDGKCAFTGGINLADEYINLYEKHGYWKDSALQLNGAAVYSLTAMFATMWNRLNPEGSHIPVVQQCPDRYNVAGLVIPFADSPDDNEMLGENIYINLINSARRYVYITTPYLILDNEMRSALILAAKNGTDIRIITPHIADKKFVHAVTRANYKELIINGVRIYEFIPGFIHAKNFVSDDLMSVVGTVNLDFRSLYLHYECGVWMYNTTAVADVKQDFIKTLDLCEEITLKNCEEQSILKRAGCALLRLLSPLM